MVGGDYDNRLVRVLFVELIGHANSLVEIQHLVDGVSDIVAMACVIDHSAFNLEEETIFLFVHQEINSSTCDLFKGQVVLVLVQCVGNVVTLELFVLLVALEQDELVGLATFLLIFLIPARKDGISGSFGLFAQCGLSLLRVGAMEVGAGKEVEVALAQVLSYFVVHVSIGLVTVERCRGGMSDGHIGGYAHGFSGLLCPHGNAVAWCLQVFQHTDGTILRLVSAGQSCSAGGRVGDAICGGIRIHQTDYGEV